MAFNPLALLRGARAVDRLFQLEKKHAAILEAQAAELQALKDQLTRLEAHVRAREAILAPLGRDGGAAARRWVGAAVTAG